MNNRILLIFTVVLLLIYFLTIGTVSGNEPRYLQVTEITMELDGPDATITVKYDLDVIAKLYVFFLGSRSIEPAVNDIFYDFKEIRIISLKDDYAVLEVKNISYIDPGQPGNFYFHDSIKLGAQVDTFNLIFPSGAKRVFSDISATPNTFFEV